MPTVTASQIKKYQDRYTKVNGLTDAPLKPLIDFYKDTSLKISQSMLSLGTDFRRAQARSTLAQIASYLKEADSETKKWVEKNMPEFYYAGVVRGDVKSNLVKAKLSQETVDNLPKVSGLGSSAFNLVHGQSIEAIITSTYNDFANGLTLTYKNAERVVSDAQRVAIRSQMAEKTIEGATLAQKTQAVESVFNNAGVVAIRDRAGKAWQLDTYATMLSRTKQMQAHNTGVGMRMVENGFDLAQITTHANSCSSCAEWEGRIISITGASPGYPTLDEVEGSGGHIFGPNCRHVFDPYHEELASKTI